MQEISNVLKRIEKATERGKCDTPNTHKYMTAHFSYLKQTLQYKAAGLN